MTENLENIKNKYGENIDYLNASLKLINKAVENVNEKNNNQKNKRTSDNNDSILEEINKLLVNTNYVKGSLPFLLDANNNIVDDRKKLLLSKVNKVLEILDSDWSIPSWIEYFKSWLSIYNDEESKRLHKMGITRYKKNIKGLVYKSFLENDPNLKYLITMTESDDDPIRTIENTIAEFKSINDETLGLKLNKNNSEVFLNETITSNKYKLKKDNEVVPIKKGGKNKIKSKTKKIKRHKKIYKKSHKNPHKNKNPK